MKKLFKIFLFFCFLGLEIVRADYDEIGINADYTTVYPGDTIKMSLGFDFVWDEGILNKESKFDEVDPIYFKFDPNIFEINDVSEFVMSDNFTLNNYDIFEDDDGNIQYVFYTSLNRRRDDEDESVDDLYDGEFNDIVISNIKLTVKNDVGTNETYYLYTTHNDDSDDFYSYLPISVINKSSNSNAVSNLYITTTDGFDLFRENKGSFDVKLSDKNIYYSGVIQSFEANCKTRCKITGIGSSLYVSDKITVKYSNGKTEKYDLKLKPIKEYRIGNEWILNGKDDDEISIIINGFDDEELNNYLKKIKKYVGNNNKVKYYTYNFNKIDNDLKDLFDILRISAFYIEEKDEYVTIASIIIGGSLQTSLFISDASDQVIEAAFSDLSMTTGNDLEIDSINDNDTYHSFFNNYLVIILSFSIIIIVIVIIILIKRKKKKSKEKDNQKAL